MDGSRITNLGSFSEDPRAKLADSCTENIKETPEEERFTKGN